MILPEYQLSDLYNGEHDTSLGRVASILCAWPKVSNWNEVAEFTCFTAVKGSRFSCYPQ